MKIEIRPLASITQYARNPRRNQSAVATVKASLKPCWYGVRKGRSAHWIGDKNASTTWKIALDKNVDGGHSTQKPLACMATPIANHEGDVYEPFSGSGTTIIACENLKRKCRAIEISPAYVAIALERWATHTGQQPQRDETHDC